MNNLYGKRPEDVLTSISKVEAPPMEGVLKFCLKQQQLESPFLIVA